MKAPTSFVPSAALSLLLLAGACSDDPAPGDATINADGSIAAGDKGVADGPTLADGGGKQDAPSVFECPQGIPANCCELIKQHEAALGPAKLCTVGADKCTAKVAGDLPCGCKTFVDASKTAEVKALQDVEAQWKSAGCPAGSSCGCADPTSSSCQSIGGADKCVDIL